MLEPFLTYDSAIDGAVFDRIGPGFVVRGASGLERVVVVLRCKGGREARGLCLAGLSLFCVSIHMLGQRTSERSPMGGVCLTFVDAIRVATYMVCPAYWLALPPTRRLPPLFDTGILTIRSLRAARFQTPCLCSSDLVRRVLRLRIAEAAAIGLFFLHFNRSRFYFLLAIASFVHRLVFLSLGFSHRHLRPTVLAFCFGCFTPSF
jgi:hypothetical protein